MIDNGESDLLSFIFNNYSMNAYGIGIGVDLRLEQTIAGLDVSFMDVRSLSALCSRFHKLQKVIVPSLAYGCGARSPCACPVGAYCGRNIRGWSNKRPLLLYCLQDLCALRGKPSDLCLTSQI